MEPQPTRTTESWQGEWGGLLEKQHRASSMGTCTYWNRKSAPSPTLEAQTTLGTGRREEVILAGKQVGLRVSRQAGVVLTRGQGKLQARLRSLGPRGPSLPPRAHQ